MKRRLSILLAAGFVLILSAGVYWQHNVDHRSSFWSFEPRYEGESLSYWVQHLYYYDQQRHVNYAAQQALLHIGTDALPLLLDWISRPYVPGEIEYQRHAVDGFEILGPMAKPAIPRLIKNVSEGSEYSMQALEFIGRDAVPPLADKLLETLADKREPVVDWRDPGYKRNFFQVQSRILRGLGRMGTNAEAAIPAVVKAMNSNQAGHVWGFSRPNPCWTLTCIGQNHPEIVIPALIGALTNSNASPLNRGDAARAMASFGTNNTDDFLPVLINAVNDKQTDDNVRRTIAGAMAGVGRHHSELVVPVLMEAFTNTNVRYRDGIVAALVVFGEDARPAVPLLLAASGSSDPHLRTQAVAALKQIAPEGTNTFTH